MTKTQTDPALFSAADCIDLYRAGRVSPVEVMQAVLARLASMDPAVNPFTLTDAEAALRAAGQSENRWRVGKPLGPVDGVPATVKDLLLTRGWPTRRGSLTTDDAGPWEDDAPAVARLREQGAVIFAKTTTPEFGWKGVTDSPLTGVTRNPWNTDMTPGGSSGGAAAAAALGLGALHIGTDGGGSVRIPAAFTGVFGFKPSFGRVPLWPASAFGSLSHAGPITRTVEDAALMLTVMAAPDHRDWQALPHQDRDYRDGLDGGVRGLRVAYSLDLGFAKVDADVARNFAAAVEVFAGLGAHVVEAGPGFDDPIGMFKTHWYAGAAFALKHLDDAGRAKLDPGLADIAEQGGRISLSEYQAAVEARNILGERMSRFHADYDLLLTPAMPIPAFEAGRETPSGGSQSNGGEGEGADGRSNIEEALIEEARWMDWTPFTYPFNLTQQPACSAPSGFTRLGLPTGLQIIGPRHADARVLRAARAFETAQPFVMPWD